MRLGLELWITHWQAAGWQTERKKSDLILSSYCHSPATRGKPFSISMSLLLKLSVWVRWWAAVCDDTSSGGGTFSCSWDGTCTKVATVRYVPLQVIKHERGLGRCLTDKVLNSFLLLPCCPCCIQSTPMRAHVMVCMWCSLKHGRWCVVLTEGCSRNRFCLQNLQPDCRCL